MRKCFVFFFASISNFIVASCGAQDSTQQDYDLSHLETELEKVKNSEITLDGISIKGPYFNSKSIEFFLESNNENFDCINLNGINGEGENLYFENDSNKNVRFPILKKSNFKLRKLDIIYADNNTQYKQLKIYKNSQKITLNTSYNFVAFSVYNCSKFEINEAQYVYQYISNSYKSNVVE